MSDHPSINIIFSVRCLTVIWCCGVVHFVNVCIGATLWIEQMSIEEYDEFLADAEGLKFSTVITPK
jgi:hypothetical protein